MEIEKKYGKFTCIDHDRDITIVIQQIQGNGYDKTAHILVSGVSVSEEKVEIFAGRTGISTAKTRDSVAEHIERRIRGNEKTGDEGMQGIFGILSPIITNDWAVTMRDACEGTLHKYYSGTPPVNLFDQEPQDDDVWRIPGLLAEDVNVIYGNSGSGKSYLAIIWAHAIQNGVSVCDLRTIRGNVLFLDYETTDRKMRRRLLRVDAGLGANGDAMLYKSGDVPIAGMLDHLQMLILEHDIQFIVIDSLARAVGGKITDEENVIRFFESIKTLEVGILIIHHTNKSDEYYGSPFIRAYARNLWRLRSVQNEGQQELSIQLEQEKENDGPGLGNIGFLMKFEGDSIDPDAVTLRLQDPMAVPALRKYHGLTEQLRAYLAETPYHRIKHAEIQKPPIGKDILGLTDPQHKTLKTYLWDMEKVAEAYEMNPDDPQYRPKYKMLNELIGIDGEYLCLNTESGRMLMQKDTTVGGEDEGQGEPDQDDRKVVLA